MPIDVSVNITAHKEGVLLYKTLRSVLSGVKYANENKVKTEINISLDRSDEETINIVKKIISMYPNFTLNVYKKDLGDLGLSRNFLIEKSKGKYIVFFDGDDFFTENFITKAYEMATKNKKPAIYSAQYILNFEGSHYISRIHSSTDKNFHKFHMFETHYFVSQNFIDKRIFENVKYKSNEGQYGSEDWHFNCEALACGFDILTVPDTIYCYRRKRNGSLLADQTNRLAVIRPSILFKKDNFVKLGQKNKTNTEKVEIATEAYKSSTEILKDKLRKYTLSYHYLKTTYNLNVGTLRALKARYYGKAEYKDDQYINPWSSPALIKERIATYAQSPPERLKAIGFTNEIVRQWGLINRFEPMIRSSWDMLEFIPIIEYPQESRISENYMNLCRRFINVPIDEILIVPHLRMGGAEQATLHLAKALSKLGRSVLVISTIETDSLWAKKADEFKNVYLVEAQEIFKNVQEEDKKLILLIKLIQNWSIKNVNVVNCELGYKLVMKYGQIMNDEGIKMFIHTYGFDVTEDGFIFNYIENGLVDCYNKGARLITDSNNFIKELVDINAFDENRLNAIYLPINPKITTKKDYNVQNKILVAGRIGNQKLPDVAVEVGKILEKHNISLEFFGNIEPEFAEENKFLKMIEEYPKINYKGIFDGFDTLKVDDYDILLLTSRTEGMANIVLEACKANIYIISTSIGGLPECIINCQNGYLIDAVDRFNPKKYAEAIVRAYNEKSFANQAKIKKANSLVLRDHANETYLKIVKKLML